MISANELRIGNWVYDELTEKDIQVKGIGKTQKGNEAAIGVWFDDDSWTAIGDDEEEFGFIRGIPLTPDYVLLFENFMMWPTGEITTSDCEYLFDPERMWLLKYSEKDGSKSYISFMELKFVHQLQNLYFALTSQDLSIGGIKE